MNEAEFQRLLEKYPKVRNADYRGPGCSPVTLSRDDEKEKGAESGGGQSRVSDRHSKIVRQAGLFVYLKRLLSKEGYSDSYRDQLVVSFLKEYERLLGGLNLEGCEELLAVVDQK